MADDGMLRLMVNHLSESGRPPSDIVAFVHTVIDNRLRPALQPTKSGSLSDLRILSRPAWEALVDILADALRDWYQGGSGTDSKWAEEVVHLLLSTSQYLLPTVSPSIRALLESDAQLCIVLDTAERTHVDPETVINFLFLVINHRAHSLDPDDCARTPQLPLKLHTFSEPALASICSMLAGALSSNVSRADYRSMPAWAYNALLLLLSDFPLPSDPGHISRALLTCLDDADLWSDQARETMKCRTGRELAERIYGDRPLYPLSIRLLCPLNDMSPSTSAGPSHTSFLVNVLQFYSSVLLRKLGSNLPETRPLWSILRSNPELFENSSARPILNDLWDFLRESSRLYLEKLATRVVVGFEDVFRATLEFGMRHPDVKVQEAVQELWRDVARNGESDIVRFHLTLLTATRRRARLADSLQHLAAPVELLQPIASELELRSVRRYSEDLEELDHVKLCSLCLELYKAELTLRGERDGALAQDRTSLWLDLAGCLDGYRERIHSGGWPIRREQKYWHDPTCPAETLRQLLDQDRIWADQCMKLIRELEAGIFRAGQPKASIPDKLKAAISYFATSDSGLASSSTLI
ncbi:uncharacterized protein PHACADRAFT_32182 [Phanerochaete carnosa HHB-10118-sp]|uniref:Uncharacterized protein n=1 Tax=Phanerochaete carnosa (strain HHB-10118-sp) TaxID=650164 RepID=K5UN60_PHACS|nr:uncharacterized protein PHACADRAFT_32182 [Phanerochaete carnosa HHB-10118-sp]EKM51171.1 hypothetical protein PHACADRAFT_32182 [Phanerochaete carnosa HHB-10118-sp]